MSEFFTRRRLLQNMGACTVLPLLAPIRIGDPPRIVVDFRNPIGKTNPLALGYNVTTFIRTAVDSPSLAAAEKKLDGRYVRIPVGLRSGRVTSGASGGPTSLDACALIRWYQARHVRVLIVLAGVSTDVNIRNGDVATLMEMMAASGVDLDSLEISSPNEPNNQKLTLEQSIALAKLCSDEVRTVKPGKRLWGPAWTWYDRNALRQFADAMGNRLAGIDFHNYAMGVKSLSTAEAMTQTTNWGKEVSEVREDLTSLSLPDQVSVSELNLSWRFDDGTPPDGKNHRFYTAVNTVWCASVVGHILRAGGSAAVYGNQNGPLGVFTEDSDATPMPAFWGLGAWTGASLFPHFADSFFEVQGSAGPSVEVFAVSNEAGGRNVILVNKSEVEPSTINLGLEGFGSHSLTVWQSDPAKPTAAPQRLVMANLERLLLPRMSVTTVVVTP